MLDRIEEWRRNEPADRTAPMLGDALATFLSSSYHARHDLQDLQHLLSVLATHLVGRPDIWAVPLTTLDSLRQSLHEGSTRAGHKEGTTRGILSQFEDFMQSLVADGRPLTELPLRSIPPLRLKIEASTWGEVVDAYVASGSVSKSQVPMVKTIARQMTRSVADHGDPDRLSLEQARGIGAAYRAHLAARSKTRTETDTRYLRTARAMLRWVREAV